MNVWTIVTTLSGMFHLHNQTTGATSAIGHRTRETAERALWTQLHADAGFVAAWRGLLAAWALSDDGRRMLIKPTEET